MGLIVVELSVLLSVALEEEQQPLLSLQLVWLSSSALLSLTVVMLVTVEAVWFSEHDDLRGKASSATKQPSTLFPVELHICSVPGVTLFLFPFMCVLFCSLDCDLFPVKVIERKLQDDTDET